MRRDGVVPAPDPEGQLRLDIEVTPLRGPRLAEDYGAGRPEATRFFSGRPDDLGSYREKLDEVNRRFGRAERERAAAAVRPTSAGAAARLERFVQEGGAMVTTGQQAGLFTGPMYTIHKILTAIRLAQALEQALGTVVLPVFWSGSEDHDFAEVNHADVVDGAGKLRRLAVAATDPRPLPMSEMRLGEDVTSVTGDLREVLASVGGADDHFRSLLDPYHPGRTVAGAFREVIERLFDGFDLLVTEASDPAVKEGSRPVVMGAVRDAAQQERLVATRSTEMEEAGYAAPVTVMPDAANVFFHGPAGRERLVRAGGGWLARDARMRFTGEELLERIRAEPAAFSPNVLLRPVVESAVFPSLAYVGGPAEIAYFAQIGPLFHANGIRPPIAFPRFSVRLVPEAAAEKARELEVTEAELRLPEHELVAAVARRRLPHPVRDRLQALRAAVVDGFGELMDAAMDIDLNLDMAVGARRNRALLEVAQAERKILSHFKKADPGTARDLPLVRNHLAPRGAPQERVLNVLPYLAMRPSLLRDIAARMEIRFAPGAAGAGAAHDGALHAPARPEPAGVSPDAIR